MVKCRTLKCIVTDVKMWSGICLFCCWWFMFKILSRTGCCWRVGCARWGLCDAAYLTVLLKTATCVSILRHGKMFLFQFISTGYCTGAHNPVWTCNNVIKCEVYNVLVCHRIIGLLLACQYHFSCIASTHCVIVVMPVSWSSAVLSSFHSAFACNTLIKGRTLSKVLGLQCFGSRPWYICCVICRQLKDANVSIKSDAWS